MPSFRILELELTWTFHFAWNMSYCGISIFLSCTVYAALRDFNLPFCMRHCGVSTLHFCWYLKHCETLTCWPVHLQYMLPFLGPIVFAPSKDIKKVKIRTRNNNIDQKRNNCRGAWAGGHSASPHVSPRKERKDNFLVLLLLCGFGCSCCFCWSVTLVVLAVVAALVVVAFLVLAVLVAAVSVLATKYKKRKVGKQRCWSKENRLALRNKRRKTWEHKS